VSPQGLQFHSRAFSNSVIHTCFTLILVLLECRWCNLSECIRTLHASNHERFIFRANPINYEGIIVFKDKPTELKSCPPLELFLVLIGCTTACLVFFLKHQKIIFSIWLYYWTSHVFFSKSSVKIAFIIARKEIM